MSSKKSGIIILLSMLLAACQSQVDMDAYCICVEKTGIAVATLESVNASVQGAETKSDLKVAWKQYKKEINEREEELIECLRSFQKMDGVVGELYLVLTTYQVNSGLIMSMLQYAEASAQEIGEIKEIASEKTKETVKEFKTLSEKLKNDGSQCQIVEKSKSEQ